MNSWENALLQFIVAAAETELPLFIHSKQGVAVLNVSEPLANALVTALSSTPSTASTQTTTTTQTTTK